MESNIKTVSNSSVESNIKTISTSSMESNMKTISNLSRIMHKEKTVYEVICKQ